MTKKILALTTGMLVFAQALSATTFTSLAQATDQTTEISSSNLIVSEDIEYTGDMWAVSVNLGPGEEGVINGNVESSSVQSIITAGSDGKLTVNGDVKRDPSVRPIDFGAAVDAYGNDVEVNGSVDGGKGRPVYAADGSTVTVNVQDQNEMALTGSRDSIVFNGGELIVNGDVQRIGTNLSDSAITTDTSSSVIVNGDIYANNPICIDSAYPIAGSQLGSVVVNGTLKKPETITNENGVRINSENVGICIRATEDTTINDIPTIAVFNIENSNDVYVEMYDENGYHTENEALKDSLQTAVENAINYIIRNASGTTLQFDDRSVTPVNVGEGRMLLSAKKGSPFEVAASLQDGYELAVNGAKVDVVDLGNGRYKMTIIDPKGGVTIVSRIKVVPSGSSSDNDSDGDTVVVEETNAVVSENFINIVSSAAGTPSANPVFADVTKPARTISLDMTKVTTKQYKDAVIRAIAATPQNGAFNIETNQVSCFDAKMIEQLASRPDIDVNVVFTYKGKKIKVVIPAGYDVKSLLDKNGYCGFLGLAGKLGFTVL